MKMFDEEVLELHELFDGLVENNLSIKQKARLQFLLENSEDARVQYVLFMDMSSSLRHYAEELVSDDFETDDDQEGLSSKVVLFSRRFLALAALLVFGFFTFPNFSDLFSPKSESFNSEIESAETSGVAEPMVDTVAVLTKLVGLKWADEAGFRPELGNTLEPNSLKIDEGLAQVEFIQGSAVILEGPIDFDIVNPNEGTLREGKLRAHVPRVARGFTVNLPKGRIIDLGTEFGLNVHPGGSSEILVYSGKVLYEGQAENAELISREISGGEALFIDPYGYPNWIEMPSEGFMSAADLAFRSMEKSQQSHSAWVELSKEIANDPHVVVYYNFDNHSPWSRVLRDEVNPNGMSGNGAIIGCKWSEGRWAGKGALGFNRKNDRVRMVLPDQFDAVTLSAWVKIDSLDYFAPILYSEPNKPGAVSWLVSKDGRLVFHVRKEDGKDKFTSAVAFRKERLGRWTHIATTYDPNLKMVSHYINGRPFSREKMAEPMSLHFGKSMLGHSLGSGNQVFKGSIDEFALFDVTYDEQSVRRIYEIGSPYEVTNLFAPTIP